MEKEMNNVIKRELEWLHEDQITSAPSKEHFAGDREGCYVMKTGSAYPEDIAVNVSAPNSGKMSGKNPHRTERNQTVDWPYSYSRDMRTPLSAMDRTRQETSRMWRRAHTAIRRRTLLTCVSPAHRSSIAFFSGAPNADPDRPPSGPEAGLSARARIHVTHGIS